MKFLRIIKSKILTLKADDTGNLYLNLDASVAVYQDIKWHIGAIFSLEQGVIDSSLTKQKINLRSSTEAKLISIDEKISKMV